MEKYTLMAQITAMARSFGRLMEQSMELALCKILTRDSYIPIRRINSPMSRARSSSPRMTTSMVMRFGKQTALQVAPSWCYGVQVWHP